VTPTLVLTAAFLAGLLLRPLAVVSADLVAVFLALALLLTEMSRPTADSAHSRLRPLILFAALRFTALPPLLYLIARSLVPDLAQGVGLLALVPVGVAAPTLTSSVGGNAARSSALLAITTVVFLCWTLALQELSGIGCAGDLAAQVAAIALLPLVVAIPLRRGIARYHLPWNRRYASHTALFLVALTISVVTARSWQVAAAHPSGLVALAGVAALEFALFYLVAGGFSRAVGEENSASYLISSGFNNNVLGAVLAALHLSPLTALFMAASNPVCSAAFVAWSAWRGRRGSAEPST
jgi:predicted Na+-dependent transporter